MSRNDRELTTRAELIDSGVLQEINRILLNPAGLRIKVDMEGDDITRMYIVQNDAPGGVVICELDSDKARARHAAFHRRWQANVPLRQAIMRMHLLDPVHPAIQAMGTNLSILPGTKSTLPKPKAPPPPSPPPPPSKSPERSPAVVVRRRVQ